MANYAINAKELDKKWQDLYANKPVPTENPWEQKSQEYLSQYENRTPFSYNVNEDALYQQYKDQYVQQGKLASMDTMGQAAAMTGGYGNSYAQGAGQQAYQMYLSRLNDVVPQLQEMAYSRHNQEGQDMLTNYSLYKGLSDEIRNQDEIALDNWYRELEFISGERNTAEANSANERSSLINLIAATGYNPTDAEIASAGMTKEQVNSYTSAYKESQAAAQQQAAAEVKPKEQTASRSDIRMVKNEIASVETSDQLDMLVTMLLAEGWSEGWIRAAIADKDEELLAEEERTERESNPIYKKNNMAIGQVGLWLK